MSGVPPPLRPAERLPPERFNLPVTRMREGYYSDRYFVRTRDVLIGDFDNDWVGTSLAVARAVDAEGFRQVQITVSGFDFTGDVVLVDGNPAAKAGRWYRPNPRLELVP